MPKNTGVGSLSFLQGIFPTQESNQGLLHCRQILYQLSYEGNLSSIWEALKCFLALVVKNPPVHAEDIRDLGSIPGSGRSLEKGVATHSSILAWRILWTEELGGLQYLGSHRVYRTEAT